MSLRKIVVCQNDGCQSKGAKSVQHRLESEYAKKYTNTYPDLQIESGDCAGDCDVGPVVRVNDSIVLRHVQHEDIDRLLSDPQSVVGKVMHVLEQDRDTFERIITGDLF